MGNNKFIIRIILIIVFAISLISIYLIFSLQTPNKPLSGQGSSIEEEAKIGGEFELTDQNGNNFNSRNLKGKINLIYFGFTYCPDVCPASLQKLSTVIETLEKYQIDINPVFITIDPERDTATVLKEYTAHFHPKFIALTGTKEQIKDVADKFKVYYSRAPDNSNNNYMLNHTSFVYLLDKNFKFLKHFYYDTSPEEIVEFIRINNR